MEHPKTRLQTLAHQRHFPNPEYSSTELQGGQWASTVKVGQFSFKGQAQGKKASEAAAAAKAFDELSKDEYDPDAPEEEDTPPPAAEAGEPAADGAPQRRAAPVARKPKKAVLQPGLAGVPGLQRLDECRVLIQRGFVDNMRTEGLVYASEALLQLLLEEWNTRSNFTPSLEQVANVAGLPGVVGRSMGMPDIHSGYGFAIGNVCAVDTADPAAVVSPGGVGFDINCGVRLVRTNLMEADVLPVKEELAAAIFKKVPVGAGSEGGIPLSDAELTNVLRHGMGFLLQKGTVWPEDVEHCEERGCIASADPKAVSARARKRGLTQVGTLGSGNHYTEVQVVDEILDPVAAEAMGLGTVGRVVVMVHSGSRGLGHQVCTDYLAQLDAIMATSTVKLNDRQLACAPIRSPQGQNYLAAMAAAANFAFCNRSLIVRGVREAFEQVFGRTARDMDMHTVYDVCHNIAKLEEHRVDGVPKQLLVHRKGATRAFPPGHPSLPERYQKIGQPVLIGGCMGTCSYVLTGTERGMAETWGSTCHGAGRELSRAAAMRRYDSRSVLQELRDRGIVVRTGCPRQAAEECDGAYKDVTKVVQTCHDAGISKLCVRLRPLAVIKG